MTERDNVEVFILMNREVLKPEAKPGKQMRYDDNMQLWVNQQTGEPIVLEFFEGSNRLCSEFGETDMTKTQEGADQSEALQLSEFGETTITRTQEGADQSEMLGFSEFGETVITETREGADQSEMLGFSEFGETRLTATSEGADQGEIFSLPSTDHFC